MLFGLCSGDFKLYIFGTPLLYDTVVHVLMWINVWIAFAIIMQLV